ncbi:hypothetical protein OG689_10460 [Kitasatospora sp. NBC_00240]|uniref:hypothetical protein n=1 Tax=Kitasatospora sp. NBC_00240 TaxID=2903567 RepID=UPI0022580FC9|nr:hypothetical protein [Kitasatospora sp. NBC_00240]MCX5209704.1 hypothetical protein [Kitasatospora sp. NBC_00240]
MPRRRLNVQNLFDAAAEAGDETAYSIAKRTGLAQSTMHRLTKGKCQPCAATQDLFLDTYSIPFDKLMTADRAAA